MATKKTVISGKAKTKPAIKKVTGKEAIKRFEKEISPRGMAKTKAKQTAALDAKMKQRYPKKEMDNVLKKIVENSKKTARENSKRVQDQVKKPKINRDPRYDLYNPR